MDALKQTIDVAGGLDKAEAALREIAKVRTEALAVFRQDGKIVALATVVETDSRARQAIEDATRLEADLRDLKSAIHLIPNDALFGRYRDLLAAAEFQREGLEALLKVSADRVVTARRQVERERVTAELKTLSDETHQLVQWVEKEHVSAAKVLNDMLDAKALIASNNLAMASLASSSDSHASSVRDILQHSVEFDKATRGLYLRLHEQFGEKPMLNYVPRY